MPNRTTQPTPSASPSPAPTETKNVVTVRPGSHLTIKGSKTQTTIAVQQATAPRPTVTVKPSGTSTWTILATAAVTLIAAWLGQYLGHRNTRKRDAESKRLDLYERIVTTTAEIDARLGDLAASYETGHLAEAQRAVLDYTASKARLDALMVSYGVRFGTTDSTAQAIGNLSAPLQSDDPNRPLLQGRDLKKNAATVRDRRARFQREVAAIVSSPRQW